MEPAVLSKSQLLRLIREGFTYLCLADEATLQEHGTTRDLEFVELRGLLDDLLQRTKIADARSWLTLCRAEVEEARQANADARRKKLQEAERHFEDAVRRRSAKPTFIGGLDGVSTRLD